MKLTEKKLREIIKQEINESYAEDVKLYHKEMAESQKGWDARATDLNEREQTMNSVSRMKRSIHAVLEGFKKMPVSEALGTVSKGHANKFVKAMGMLESILEDTSGWLKENQ